MDEINYKIGSLFDGSGGFPLAGALCGVEPRWASEVEPYPIAVTRSRFPNMKHLGDITKINGAEVEPVDIITFGSPCQDLSVAGKQAGIKHETNGDDETTRSGLFMEAVRIIKEMRSATNGKYPSFALWENVPGAFSSNKGEDFRIVLEELVKIVEPSASMPSVPKSGWAYADSYVGEGWSLAYRVFDAQYWGVPQRRRRIHLVLDLRGERARDVLFEREGVRGYFAQGRTPWQRTPANAQGSLGANDTKGEGIDAYNGDITGDKAATLGVNCGLSSGRNGVIERRGLDAVGVDVYNQTTTGNKAKTLTSVRTDTDHVPSVVYSIENHPADSRVDIDESGKVQTLTSRMGTGGGNVPMVMEPKVFENHSQDTRYKGPLDVAQTVAATYGMGGNNQPFVVEPKDPVYCLQGNGIDRADTAGCNGKGWREGEAYTLNTIDRPAVAYGFMRQLGGVEAQKEKSPSLLAAAGESGNNKPCVAYEPKGLGLQSSAGIGAIGDNVSPCLINGDNPGWQNGVMETTPCYIVRRLTPIECARLQGFADRWGDIEEKKELTAEEYEFWLEVRNTHARVNGKKEQDYTVKQMLTWYNKLHTDSAEYKMWGNGIALPPALYVMQGIVDALNITTNEEEDLDDWMN